MSDAVILAAKRTPIGKFQGGLSQLPATELGANVIRASLAASGLPPDAVDEVIMGIVLPAGTGQAPARQAALKAGLPTKVAALTINKVCGSGLKSVMLASQAVRCGDQSVIVAGGMECMSRAPWLIERTLSGLGNKSLVDSMMRDGLQSPTDGSAMGDVAERLAKRLGISRGELDAFACESHRRATVAMSEHRFRDEIVPITVSQRQRPDGSPIITDEGPRADCTVEGLAKLKPAFVEGGIITAGNSASISDGAAAVVVASSDYAKDRQHQPLAQIVASVTSGLAPEDLFEAPVEAIRMLLAKTKHQVSDIDLWEINEAFAAQMIACQRPLEIPVERLNIRGGAIALGHPIGASGARVLTTLVHALRQENKELGVASLCLGGGNAVAMLIRRLS